MVGSKMSFDLICMSPFRKRTERTVGRNVFDGTLFGPRLMRANLSALLIPADPISVRKPRCSSTDATPLRFVVALPAYQPGVARSTTTRKSTALHPSGPAKTGLRSKLPQLR